MTNKSDVIWFLVYHSVYPGSLLITSSEMWRWFLSRSSCSSSASVCSDEMDFSTGSLAAKSESSDTRLNVMALSPGSLSKLSGFPNVLRTDGVFCPALCGPDSNSSSSEDRLRAEVWRRGRITCVFLRARCGEFSALTGTGRPLLGWEELGELELLILLRLLGSGLLSGSGENPSVVFRLVKSSWYSSCP